MKYKRRQFGFSLIELAVVIIITGLVMSAAVSAYSNYLEQKQIHSTHGKIRNVFEAMDYFFITYGRYPCPASLEAGPDDANFGVESNCLTGVVTGTFDSTGQVNNDDNLTTFVNSDIRKGAIPFKTLQEGTNKFPSETKYQSHFRISLDDTIDAHDNKFTYVLTKSQGTQNFLPRLGAVRIIDEHYNATNPLSKPLSENSIKNNADYAIITHGHNGSGAYTLYGGQVGGGCLATLSNNEQENCDNDDTYVASLRYDSGANQYDDFVAFQTWVNYFLWDVSKANDDNIYNINTGNVGIGGTDPKTKLHIFDGNIVADEAAAANASILANEYCGYNPLTGAGVDCFQPEVIAGAGLDCDNAADIIGTHSPGNSALTSIENSKLRCGRIYDSVQTQPNCPSGKFITGFTYDTNTKSLQAICD